MKLFPTLKNIVLKIRSIEDKIDDINTSLYNVDDFIVDQGTVTATHSGVGSHSITWTYRKWNSGVAELWGVRTFSSLAVTTSWNNGFYYSGGNDANYVWAIYPTNYFKSNTTPNCFASLYSSSNSLFLMDIGTNTAGAGSTPRWHAVRSGSATVNNVQVAFHAIGVWK